MKNCACPYLQASNDQLRGQLRSAQAGDARADSSVGAQLAGLELMLSQREDEVRALRQALAEQDERLELGGGAAGERAAGVG